MLPMVVGEDSGVGAGLGVQGAAALEGGLEVGEVMGGDGEFVLISGQLFSPARIDKQARTGHAFWMSYPQKLKYATLHKKKGNSVL